MTTTAAVRRTARRRGGQMTLPSSARASLRNEMIFRTGQSYRQFRPLAKTARGVCSHCEEVFIGMSKPLQIAVLAEDDHTRRRLVQDIRKRKHVALPIQPESIVGLIKRNTVSVTVPTSPRVDAIIHRLSHQHKAALHALDAANPSVPHINHLESVLRAADKFATGIALAEAGIPQPDTALVLKLKEAHFYAAKFGYPVIVKRPLGERGQWIAKASTPRELEKLFSNFRTRLQPLVIIQEYIAEASGRDIRALVVGRQVTAAVERRASKRDEFRSNLHRGGTAQAVHLTAPERRMAVHAAKAVGLEVTGIDILRSDRGPLVVEVNSFPGFSGIEKATGIDVAQAIVDFVIKKARKGA